MSGRDIGLNNSVRYTHKSIAISNYCQRPPKKTPQSNRSPSRKFIIFNMKVTGKVFKVIKWT